MGYFVRASWSGGARLKSLYLTPGARCTLATSQVHICCSKVNVYAFISSLGGVRYRQIQLVTYVL